MDITKNNFKEFIEDFKIQIQKVIFFNLRQISFL